MAQLFWAYTFFPAACSSPPGNLARTSSGDITPGGGPPGGGTPGGWFGSLTVSVVAVLLQPTASARPKQRASTSVVVAKRTMNRPFRNR